MDKIEVEREYDVDQAEGGTTMAVASKPELKEIFDSLTPEQIEHLAKEAERIKGLKTVPYVGYSCGKVWIVGGVRHMEARQNACREFIEEFREILPSNVTIGSVLPWVGARVLGDEWKYDIKEVARMIQMERAEASPKGAGRKKRDGK